MWPLQEVHVNSKFPWFLFVSVEWTSLSNLELEKYLCAGFIYNIVWLKSILKSVICSNSVTVSTNDQKTQVHFITDMICIVRTQNKVRFWQYLGITCFIYDAVPTMDPNYHVISRLHCSNLMNKSSQKVVWQCYKTWSVRKLLISLWHHLYAIMMSPNGRIP